MRIFCFKNLLFCFFSFFLSTKVIAEDYIVVNKKNVMHTFVQFDAETDYFTRNIFWNWENDTFEVFDKVKDLQGIAIDLGAWIGTTAIWLSKNFHHVIVIEADRISLNCLQKNLIASDCHNISICDKAIGDKNESVIFGPRGNQLNESISSIKRTFNNQNDYLTTAITFRKMLDDYFYSDNQLNSRRIAFIKCDIEGGEENILQDILQFSFYNQCPVYMSFHLSWWQSKNINDFKDLFGLFETNCPSSDVCEYVRKNPFASILFLPKTL